MQYRISEHSLITSIRNVQIPRNVVFITWITIFSVMMIPSAHSSWEKTYFYVGENFKSLLAAPREPQFFGGYQHLQAQGPLDSFNAALVGLGENFGLIRWRDRETQNSWEIGVTTGLVSLFKLNQKSSDLINSDFLVGLTTSYGNSEVAYRTRLYHQSSHLGDEFLLQNKDLKRINYSYEALDFTGSRNWGPWRTYAGGSYILHSKPTDIGKATAQIGSEYRGFRPLWRGAYLKAAFNTEFTQENDWATNLSALLGIEFGKSRSNTRRFGLQLEVYDGYSPWGQFYNVRVRSYGSSMYIRF
ncbi:MAG: DUF1207 domain-containing protein [Gammaproteobacteria bacterium]|nr:DUF1207 domain-containing protein [Gammaproteobacteria bacterium]